MTFDTPITTDDNGIKSVFKQKQPTLLILLDGEANNSPLLDAMKTAAKKHVGDLLIAKLDATENPQVYQEYDQPALPALVTVTHGFFGPKVKSSAEQIRPADLRAHVEHLLTDAPLSAPKKQRNGNGQKRTTGTVHLSERTFNKTVANSKKPVLVDFWAPWCGPCRSIAPFIDKMATQYGDAVTVAKLNTDQNPRIAQTYDIQSIPTMILFRDGKPAERLVGANPSAIKNMLEDIAHGH
jgi:thioredoxin 1